MSFVSLEDFALRYGSAIPSTDEARVVALLDDACSILQTEIGLSYEDDDTIPKAIVSVVVAATRRAYENPQGYSGETMGSYSWRGAQPASGGVYFTLAEKKICLRAAGQGAIQSVELTSDLYAPADDDQFLETDSGAPILYFDREDLP